VKFFHFTQSYRLAGILEEGIKPIEEGEGNYFFGPAGDAAPEGVVWLTAVPQNPHAIFSVVADVRITLNLPMSPRLHRWEPWLKKHSPRVFAILDSLDQHDDLEHNSWRSFWFHEGTIGPDTFTAVEVEELGYAGVGYPSE
jgi:hypothetical protein